MERWKGGLALSRREGERIHIGGDVIVSVIEIRGDRVRLHIEAPKNKTILRHEIVDREKPAKGGAA